MHAGCHTEVPQEIMLKKAINEYEIYEQCVFRVIGGCHSVPRRKKCGVGIFVSALHYSVKFRVYRISNDIKRHF